MSNNTTLRDGNDALFVAESIDVGSGIQRTSTAANLRVANTDVAASNPVPVAESAGTPISGTSMPTGGVGLTGWLSGIFSKLSGLLQANLYIGGTIVSATNAVPMFDAYQAPTTASWASATAVNTAMTLTTAGYDTVIFTIAATGTMTAGAIIFEANDGTNWVTVKAARTDSYLTDTTFSLTGTPGTHSWQLTVAGYPQVRARLATAIVGSGSVSLVSIVSSAPDVSLVTVGLDPSQPLPAGTNAIGSVTVATLPAIPAGANAIGSVTVSTLPALPVGSNSIGSLGASAASGAITTTSRLVSAAATTNATSVKASGGRLYKITGYSPAAAIRYLKLYNKASAPTVGTDVPIWTQPIPNSQYFVLDFGDVGLYFGTGIAYAITTGSADTDTGVLTANDIAALNVAYA